MVKFYLLTFVCFLFLQKSFSQAAFSIQGNLCQNNTLNFIDESSSASSWNWDFGDGNSSIEQNPTHTYTNTGTFDVVLTIANNTTSYPPNTKTIQISSNPIVAFTADSTQFYYSTYSRVFIDASILYNPIDKYIWNFGDGSMPLSTDSASTLYKYGDNGSYLVWLKVIDNKGCVDSISNTIDIHDRFFIPNVFTPNGDELNDEFIVTSNGNTLFSIEIFSRWGNLVFKRTGYQQITWDGHMPNGLLVRPGTYYYVINSESGNKIYEPEKGFITIFHNNPR